MGEPVIVMHGGPGAGSHSSLPRFFDPQLYSVVLFDQRGCERLVKAASARIAWDEVVSPRYRNGEPAPGTSRERFTRMLDAAQHLADHIHEAPVWIIPCMGGAGTRTSGSSVYPAVQNMLLAARALGLGATLTTLYLNFEEEVDAALGLPEDVHSYALLPIGYPIGRFGPVRRVPLDEVVYRDRWGQPFADA